MSPAAREYCLWPHLLQLRPIMERGLCEEVKAWITVQQLALVAQTDWSYAISEYCTVALNPKGADYCRIEPPTTSNAEK